MSTILISSRHFRGKGRTLKDPIIFTVEEAFTFGGVYFPKGCEVKQFESTNFGWTVRTGGFKAHERGIGKE